MQQPLEQVGSPLVADTETAIAEQPGKHALHHPSVPSESLAGVDASALNPWRDPTSPRAPAEDLHQAVAEWERRRNATLEQLQGLPVVRPAGGWSLLLDAEALGISPPDLSRALAAQKVAATPMTAWGEHVAPRYIRFVYSNEPVERLAMLGERLRAALAQGS